MVHEAAEAGEVEAQYALGMLYVNGNGMPADLVKAANWIEMGAQRSGSLRNSSLGSCMYGKGVPQDFPRAIVSYELAAQLGYAPAQYNLGIMLAKGQGCEPDRDRALPWFQKAAEQGLSAAQTALREIGGPDRHSCQPNGPTSE